MAEFASRLIPNGSFDTAVMSGPSGCPYRVLRKGELRTMMSTASLLRRQYLYKKHSSNQFTWFRLFKYGKYPSMRP